MTGSSGRIIRGRCIRVGRRASRRYSSGHRGEFGPRQQHIVKRAKGVREMTLVAACLKRAKQSGKVEISLAGKQMLLLATAEAIGQPYLGHAVQRHRREEPVDPFRNQMRMIRGER